MLSKEEIEKTKRDLAMLSYTHKHFSVIVDNTLKYINQLESREQKLIEKLEEDIREETGYAKWIDSHTKRISPTVTTMIRKSQYAKEILEILKEE